MSAPVDLPWYARTAATVGRPVVLLAALAMSAPGEYQLARLAGWDPSVAWLMPVTVSVYAAVAAVIAATRPKGVAGRGSALVGAGVALALALAAQVVAHLVTAGHMATSAALVAATSAVPPIVVAHMLHLAATPATSAPEEEPEAVAVEEDVTGQEPAVEEDVTVAAPEEDTSAPEDTLPGLEDMAAPEDTDTSVEEPAATVTTLRPRRVSVPRDRTLEEIRAAVATLSADGRKVKGKDLAAYFGVSERTGRRYLRSVLAA